MKICYLDFLQRRMLPFCSTAYKNMLCISPIPHRRSHCYQVRKRVFASLSILQTTNGRMLMSGCLTFPQYGQRRVGGHLCLPVSWLQQHSYYKGNSRWKVSKVPCLKYRVPYSSSNVTSDNLIMHKKSSPLTQSVERCILQGDINF